MIVDELAECGERSVQELTAMVGTDGSTVSRHLSTLKNAGVVASRKSGTTVYYCLRMKCIPKFLNCVESMLRENAAVSARLRGIFVVADSDNSQPKEDNDDGR